MLVIEEYGEMFKKPIYRREFEFNISEGLLLNWADLIRICNIVTEQEDAK